jgi:hypothetical protein
MGEFKTIILPGAEADLDDAFDYLQSQNEVLENNCSFTKKISS